MHVLQAKAYSRRKGTMICEEDGSSVATNTVE